MPSRQSMRFLARWHIRLGWLVAIPLLLWTVSGLFMAARPIEEVRGEHLRAPAPPVEARGLVLPQQQGPIGKLSLISQPGQPVWIVTAPEGEPRRYSALTGALLGEVGEAEARGIARAAFAGKARLTALRRFSAAKPPLDLRRPRPSWRAAFEDGTHLYIDAGTGEVLALRTGYWRAYDLMWGLHIMDLSQREDTSHPLLIVSAAVSLAGVLMGAVLLFRRRKRKPDESK